MSALKCKVCEAKCTPGPGLMWCQQCFRDFNSYADMGGYDAADVWGAKRRAAAKKAGGK